MAEGTTTQLRFAGLPDEVFGFLAGLEQDNTREYWERHRATWTDVIQPAVDGLMAALEPEFGSLRTFRPQRDVRFSPDKTPYKTWIGVTTSDRAVGGVGSFVRVDPTGMRVACGAMAFAPDQVKRFRQALDAPATALELQTLRGDLAERGLVVGPGKQPVLQRPPTGFAADHPQAEMLRWKGAVIVREHDRSAWMTSPEVVERVAEVWRAGGPLTEWIERNVGHSATPARRPR